MESVLFPADTESLRERWRRVNSSYYDAMTAQMASYLDALDAPLLEICHGRVLELAAGTGRMLTKILASSQVQFAVGLDLMAQMLAQAAAKGHQNLIQSYAESLPFAAASFDAVVCTFYSLRDIDRPPVYAEIARVLAPGGQFGFTLRNYYVAYLETLWRHFLRQGRLPNSFHTLDGADGVLLDLKDIDAEIAAIERAGLIVREIRSLRFLPFLRRLLGPGYWSGKQATKFGSDIIILVEKS